MKGNRRRPILLGSSNKSTRIPRYSVEPSMPFSALGSFQYVNLLLFQPNKFPLSSLFVVVEKTDSRVKLHEARHDTRTKSSVPAVVGLFGLGHAVSNQSITAFLRTPLQHSSSSATQAAKHLNQTSLTLLPSPSIPVCDCVSPIIRPTTPSTALTSCKHFK